MKSPQLWPERPGKASSPQMIQHVSMPLAHMLLGLGIGNAWIALRMQTCAKTEPKPSFLAVESRCLASSCSIRSNEALCSLASILASAIDVFHALHVEMHPPLPGAAWRLHLLQRRSPRRCRPARAGAGDSGTS